MKWIFFFFAILLISIQGFAQVSDPFSDNDFTNNPTWGGETSKFQVASQRLQLNGLAATDTAYLSTANSLFRQIEWSFIVQLNFAPSDNNLLRVYLMSNTADLKSSTLQGYYLKMGENGSADALELYRQNGPTHTLIARGTNGRFAAPRTMMVKVLRDYIGNWSLYTDSTLTSTYNLEITGFDSTYQSTQAFGFWCKYTTSNKNNFAFDDVYVGPERMDTIPPKVVGLTLSSPNSISILMDESVTQASGTALTNYFIDQGIGFPISATLSPSATEITLTLASALPNATLCSLTVGRLSDLKGNLKAISIHPFSLIIPQPYDVVISELMPDPDPPVGLPNTEYVELTNRLSTSVDLIGWTLDDGGTPVVLPNLRIPAGGSLALAPSSQAGNFVGFRNVVGVPTLPSLNNSGDAITLKNGTGQIIHQVTYSDAWHQNSIKKGGGWSLEMIDLSVACVGKGNWTSSNDSRGGTPGEPNSVRGTFQDTTPLQVSGIRVIHPDTVEISFNLPLETPQKSWFNSPLLVIDTLLPNGNQSVLLKLNSSLVAGAYYWLKWNRVATCFGSFSGHDSALIGLPVLPQLGDWTFSEILFDPRTGGVDYVELYHRGKKMLDLKDLIFSTEDASGNTIDFASLPTGKLAVPSEYYVLTSNPATVQNQFFCLKPQNLVPISLPSLGLSNTRITLRTRSLSLLDSLEYSESWHSTLLKDTKGVALEKLDLNALSTDSKNWYSASSRVGHGTPTGPNSQNKETLSDEISWSTDIITPNGDGDRDLLFFQIPNAALGSTLSVRIFDTNGFLWANPYERILAGATNELRWDGTNRSGALVPQGLYIVWVQLMDTNGKTQIIKKTITVVP
jgi:hypothetical protein